MPLLVGSINTYSSPPPTRGDELSDAIAAQKRLAAKIKAQKAQVAQLAALQVGLSTTSARPQTALAGVNPTSPPSRSGSRSSAPTSRRSRPPTPTSSSSSPTSTRSSLDHARGAGQGRPARGTQGDPRRAAPGGLRSRRTSLLETILSADSFTTALSDVELPARPRRPRQGTRRPDRGRPGDPRRRSTRPSWIRRRDRASCGSRRPPRRRRSTSSSTDFRKAKAQLKVLQAETKRQLALQRAAYQALAANKVAGRRRSSPQAARRPPGRSRARSTASSGSSSPAAASRRSTTARSAGR